MTSCRYNSDISCREASKRHCKNIFKSYYYKALILDLICSDNI